MVVQRRLSSRLSSRGQANSGQSQSHEEDRQQIAGGVFYQQNFPDQQQPPNSQINSRNGTRVIVVEELELKNAAAPILLTDPYTATSGAFVPINQFQAPMHIPLRTSDPFVLQTSIGENKSDEPGSYPTSSPQMVRCLSTASTIRCYEQSYSLTPPDSIPISNSNLYNINNCNIESEAVDVPSLELLHDDYTYRPPTNTYAYDQSSSVYPPSSYYQPFNELLYAFGNRGPCDFQLIRRCQKIYKAAAREKKTNDKPAKGAKRHRRTAMRREWKPPDGLQGLII
ncbi:hypothetical protein DdX_05700 [Ditylenchus destructor]|uniref:Uncharacterized protein n=1 Tax=Ditylenchus destructor TaxID=166010 RepID=A0AAD4N824_9BILA|nr:hypothetical protein DdX_05700 [Ditylenchus destructor]